MKLNEIADNPGADARPASASAAASAPARARPPAAAARARRRAPASPSRASRAARCRCIGACRSAASPTSSASDYRRGQPRPDPGGDRRRASSTPARRSTPTALKAAGVIRRAKDGVRLLGGGELTAQAHLRRRRRLRAGASPRSRRRAASVKVVEARCRRSEQGRSEGASQGSPSERTMASAAEQLAANLNFGAFAKAEELKKRIWFTLGALLVYRLGTYIPLPGINLEALHAGVPAAVQRHPRHVQHVRRRRGRPHGDLRARHHAVHLGLDHHAADDRGRSARSSS